MVSKVKNIFLKNRNISYTVYYSNQARYLRITIYANGELAIILPRGMNFKEIEDFLRKKADWILRKINLAKKRKPSLILPKASRREYLAKKNDALVIVKNKISHFSSLYKLHPARIFIRNQRTRWGSCSERGNLSFSYRIIHLPEKYLNYVIVHELCHLKEFNHSRRFWDLVAQAIPDYKKIRKEIRNL